MGASLFLNRRVAMVVTDGGEGDDRDRNLDSYGGYPTLLGDRYFSVRIRKESKCFPIPMNLMRQFSVSNDHIFLALQLGTESSPS